MNYKNEALRTIKILEHSMSELEAIKRSIADDYKKEQINNIKTDISFVKSVMLYGVANRNGMFNALRQYTADNMYTFEQAELSQDIKRIAHEKSEELNEELGGNYADDVWGWKWK